jgi:hypothetical protein
MNGGYVSAHSRVMRAVALSTAEAELMAATEAAKDLAHLANVFDGFGLSDVDATLGEDNAAALLMATDINHSVTSRSKHIQARHFYVRERCMPSEDDDGKEIPPALRMFAVPTKMMRADIMTKATDKDTFKFHRDYMVKHVPTEHHEHPKDAQMKVHLAIW